MTMSLLTYRRRLSAPSPVAMMSPDLAERKLVEEAV